MLLTHGQRNMTSSLTGIRAATPPKMGTDTGSVLSQTGRLRRRAFSGRFDHFKGRIAQADDQAVALLIDPKIAITRGFIFSAVSFLEEEGTRADLRRSSVPAIDDSDLLSRQRNRRIVKRNKLINALFIGFDDRDAFVLRMRGRIFLPCAINFPFHGKTQRHIVALRILALMRPCGLRISRKFENAATVSAGQPELYPAAIIGQPDTQCAPLRQPFLCRFSHV